MMDPRSTTEDKWLIYELCYPDRTGENYSLPASEAARNKWFYYPEMHVDECLLFSVYDRGVNDHRFFNASSYSVLLIPYGYVGPGSECHSGVTCAL